MLEEIRQNERLFDAADALLKEAAVTDLLPTPVPRLLGAAGLHEPKCSLLDDAHISQAPPHLAAKIRALSGKVQAVLDRQESEVHLRPDVAANGGGAFKRLHEVGHAILPWQVDLAFADDRYTLSSEVRALWELEASQVAAELMFQRTLLQQVGADRDICASTVIDLASQFGASIHSTFRRYVETHDKSVAGVVLEMTPICIVPACFQRQEAFCSRRWNRTHMNPRMWPFQLEGGPFTHLSNLAAGFQTASESGVEGPFLGKVEWPDRNGEIRKLRVEVFSNSYNLFMLLRPIRSRPSRA